MMLFLFFLFFLMLALSALVIFLVAKIKHKYFIFLMTAIIFSSLGLYQFTSDQAGLKLWLTQGKEHYRLLETFEQLGGVDGAIASIKKKLIENPNDMKGWLILGKLYLAKQDEKNANDAFKHAQEIMDKKV